jgi:hypothetical protein
MTASERLERFVAFSADVTAFTQFELQGTGQAQSYLAAVDGVVGADLVDALLDAHGALLAEDPSGSGRDDALRRSIFSHELLGPVARNVIKLWYVGTWYEMPREWSEAFGALENNFTFMVSPAAYTEGLLWTAVGANPPGAKAPGYGSWAEKPLIPPIRGRGGDTSG